MMSDALTPSPRQSPDRLSLVRYLAVVLLVGLAMLARRDLAPLYGDTASLVALYLAVLLCAWLGGLGPGLVATGLGALAGYLDPLTVSASPTASFWIGALLLIGVVTSWLIEALRQARQQAEAAAASLRQSERSFRRLVETANEGVWVLDADGRTSYVNQRLAEMLGFGIDEILGRFAFEFAFAEERSAREQNFRFHMIDVSEQTEARFRRRDGTELWAYVNTNPVFDEEGHLIGVLGMFTDISNQKRIEADQRRLFTISNDLLRISDLDGRIVQLNAAWEAVLGYSLAEIKALPSNELIHPEDLEPTFAARQRMLTEQVLHNLENRYRGRDGAYRWLSWNAVYCPETGLIYASARDVTEQKRAEQEREDLLRQLEAKHAQLRTIIDQIPAGLMIAEAPSGRLLLWNHQTHCVFPQSWPPLAGCWPPNGLTACRADGLPLPLEEWPLGRALQHGAVVRDEEIRIRRVDGMPGTLSVSASPIIDSDGAIIAAVMIGHDISAHKEAQEALKFSADVGATLTASLDYASTVRGVLNLAVPALADHALLSLCQPDGTLRHESAEPSGPASHQARSWALALCAAPGCAVTRLVDMVVCTRRECFYPELNDPLLAALSSDPRTVRWRRRLRIYSVLSVPLLAHGHVLGALTLFMTGSGHPYTPRELAQVRELARIAALTLDHSRLYQQLRESDQRKDEFLAMLGHELRNPLASMHLAVELIGQHQARQAPVTRELDTLHRQIGHVTRLVDDLLDVSRITRGKIELRRGPVELAAIVRQAAESAQPFLESQRQQLYLELPPAPLWLNADPTRLEQILINLLNNAAKYSEPDRRIWLSVEVQPEGLPDGTPDGADAVPQRQALLRVRDEGLGISPAMLPRIFDLFTQAHRTLDRKQGGLGIGLTLVRSLVELHGGRVEAHSAGPGQGSEFLVRLPLTELSEPQPGQVTS